MLSNLVTFAEIPSSGAAAVLLHNNKQRNLATSSAVFADPREKQAAAEPFDVFINHVQEWMSCARHLSNDKSQG